MDIIKPVRLQSGDIVGITAPSMHIIDKEAVSRGISALQTLGFKVEIGATVASKYRNTTAPPEERTKELMTFFERPDIRAIVCLIGGDTASQLLRLIDYNVISRNPKIFSGMSDISHLHLAFLSKAKILSLHGIDLIWGFGAQENDPATKYNVDLFMKCCTRDEPLGTIPHLSEWECWRDGKARGRLVGGWLGAVSSLARTQYWPALNDILFFWEAVGAEVHDIERELTILEADGFFDNVAGMIVGKLVDCEEKTYPSMLPSVRDIVLEVTKRYKFPIIGNADFGHDVTNMPMPEGILTQMDAQSLAIDVLESMVK